MVDCIADVTGRVCDVCVPETFIKLTPCGTFHYANFWPSMYGNYKYKITV